MPSPRRLLRVFPRRTNCSGGRQRVAISKAGVADPKLLNGDHKQLLRHRSERQPVVQLIVYCINASLFLFGGRVPNEGDDYQKGSPENARNTVGDHDVVGVHGLCAK
jgi:hypothetical protein